MSERVRLSKAEVADLCGSPQRSRQIGFLRFNGIRHYVQEDGWPVVLWCHIDPAHGAAEDRKTWKPNKAA